MNRKLLPLALRLVLISLSAALLPGHGSDAIAQNASPAPANSTTGHTIDIPEGTPVIVHFFGTTGTMDIWDWKTPDGAAANQQIIQVDADVLVNGVLVVPRGSIGTASVDSLKDGTYRENYGKVRQGFVMRDNYGPKQHGVIAYDFHFVSVLSIASTLLEFDPALVTIDEHHFGSYHQKGIAFPPDTEFTAKLKHAVVLLPPGSESH